MPKQINPTRIIEAWAKLNVAIGCLHMALEDDAINVDMAKAKRRFNVNPVHLVKDELVEVYQILSDEVAKCDSSTKKSSPKRSKKRK